MPRLVSLASSCPLLSALPLDPFCATLCSLPRCFSLSRWSLCRWIHHMHFSLQTTFTSSPHGALSVSSDIDLANELGKLLASILLISTRWTRKIHSPLPTLRLLRLGVPRSVDWPSRRSRLSRSSLSSRIKRQAIRVDQRRSRSIMSDGGLAKDTQDTCVDA